MRFGLQGGGSATAGRRRMGGRLAGGLCLAVLAGWLWEARAAPPAKAAPELARFHARLADLDAGRSDLLAVLQIGDSHTASDHLSGRLRQLLQARFGDAGRGYLPPGAPYAYYRPQQVTVSQTAGWQVLSSNKTLPDAVAFGLSGYVARARDAVDAIAIVPRAPAALRAIDIGVLTRADGGTLGVWVDDRQIGSIETRLEAGARAGHRVVRLGLPEAVGRIELRPIGEGPVDVTGHGLVGSRRGVTLSNLGFPGAQIGILGRWHWPAVAARMRDIDPALVILAFGTNEGFAAAGRIGRQYEAVFARHLAAIRAAAPNASIVVVGPPDANRYPRYCFPPDALPPLPPLALLPPEVPSTASPPAVAARRPPPRPLPEPPADTPCTPLTDAERAAYDGLIGSRDRSLCRWHTPAAIAIVREAQRRVAARAGVLFFDWGALPGGECGADRWARQGLAHKDRVHLKANGYARVAERLHAALMAGYVAPRRGR